MAVLITAFSEAQDEEPWERAESALKWGCHSREDGRFLGDTLLNIFSAWSRQN